MRIVHLHTNLRWGGGENQLYCLLRGTRGEEFRPLLLARKHGELYHRAKASGLETQSFDFLSRYGFLSIGRLTGILREKEATILHLHDGDSVSLGIPAAKFYREAKVVIHRRISSPLRKNFLTRWKYSSNRVASYIAVSQSVKKALLDFEIPEEKIRLIPSGVDFEKLTASVDRKHLRKQLKLGEGIWIGTVTTLEPKKNNETFLQAASRIAEKIPETKFLIVGDGPEREKLKRLASSLGLHPDRLHFAGYQEEAHRFIAALDLFLFPSLREGSPGALKEAMGLSIPVVAANAPGTDEIIREGTGVLVPPKNADVFADAAMYLLQNPAKAREMAARARDLVAREFSIQKTIEKTAALYREIV